jgi:threonyl-tRNA synthetase
MRGAITLNPAAFCGMDTAPLTTMSEARKTLEERAQMSDIDRLRHSCAHVMATAILRLWPNAQFAYGPPVENGFYYDFDLPDHRITPDDFEKIEAEMKKISKENQKFEWKGISREEAKAMAEVRSPRRSERAPGQSSVFKLDLIDKIPEGEQISTFQNGDFIDLCAGPHVGYSGKCKHVKIMSVASAFYMGDETKPQLQRLYGTAFPTAKNSPSISNSSKRRRSAITASWAKN